MWSTQHRAWRWPLKREHTCGRWAPEGCCTRGARGVGPGGALPGERRTHTSDPPAPETPAARAAPPHARPAVCQWAVPPPAPRPHLWRRAWRWRRWGPACVGGPWGPARVCMSAHTHSSTSYVHAARVWRWGWWGPACGGAVKDSPWGGAVSAGPMLAHIRTNEHSARSWVLMCVLACACRGGRAGPLSLQHVNALRVARAWHGRECSTHGSGVNAPRMARAWMLYAWSTGENAPRMAQAKMLLAWHGLECSARGTGVIAPREART